jgi:hypothetical protein
MASGSHFVDNSVWIQCGTLSTSSRWSHPTGRIPSCITGPTRRHKLRSTVDIEAQIYTAVHPLDEQMIPELYSRACGCLSLVDGPNV